MRERIVRTGIILIAVTGVHLVQGQDLHRFVDGLAELRAELRIPAMQTAVMAGDSVLLEKTFGAPSTAVFRIASITKTFTSTLVMQLVEKGKLSLDAPVSNFGIDLGNPGITVRELLTHTSEEQPGSWYSYNGYRFGRLGQVLEKVTGIPYYELLMENIVKPLHMYSTAPGDSLTHYFSYLSKHRDMADFFETSHARLVRAYRLDSLGHPVEAGYLDEFGAFGGLATSAGDLLKYSSAIDHNRLVSAATQREIFTPNKTAGGALTPYGLGWFVENYEGVDYYWHYGQTSPGESGIFLKVPSKKLTVVVLANTDGLSAPFPLGDGDLFMSPVGQLIYRSFISGQPVDRNFKNKELIVRASIDRLGGDTAAADQLYAEYGRENFKGVVSLPPADGDAIAELRQVRVNQDLTRPFHLQRRTRLRVYGVGEDCSGDHRTWCDFGWIEDGHGKVVWQMAGQPVQPAGGAAKNQRVDEEIELPAGQYSLRYKSDWGHAYDNWDSIPPDNYFWGIILYKIK